MAAVDKYLSALPSEQKQALEKMRATIKRAVPDAQEEIKTGVPAVRYRGKTVVSFGAAKEHLSLYVMYGDALKELKDELANYDTSNTVIRFTADKPLPATLVNKIVKFRLGEIDGSSR